MTKDEARSAVMGAISMALKDPTLQQGFEIICKENAELKEQLGSMQDAECSSCTTLGGLQIKINDIEKENAELKAGRPKWHKVADGDLPPEDTDVLALLADKEIYMAHFYRRNVWDKIGPVIAWCEIPLYTEE